MIVPGSVMYTTIDIRWDHGDNEHAPLITGILPAGSPVYIDKPNEYSKGYWECFLIKLDKNRKAKITSSSYLLRSVTLSSIRPIGTGPMLPFMELTNES